MGRKPKAKVVKQKLLPAPESSTSIQARRKEEAGAGLIGMSAEKLIEVAIKNNSAIDVIERLMAMRERVQKDIAERAYNEEMAAFQSACPVIVKSNSVDYTSKRSGTHVKYDYAPLDVIVLKTRSIIADHGFSYRFTTAQDQNSVTAICHIRHALGHEEKTSFTVPIEVSDFMKASHTVASALTYAKRYAFCNGFGIMTGESDTDDNQPEDNKKKNKTDDAPPPKTIDPAEVEKKRQEATDRMAALPDNIKAGFEALGYNAKQVYDLCEYHKWENHKIYKSINEIANAHAAGK